MSADEPVTTAAGTATSSGWPASARAAGSVPAAPVSGAALTEAGVPQGSDQCLTGTGVPQGSDQCLTGTGVPQESDQCRRLSTSDGALVQDPTDDTPPYSESESDSAAASKPSSLQGSLDGKESDYTDTICSNRSDFFKRYYAPQTSPTRSEPAAQTNGYTPLRPAAETTGSSTAAPTDAAIKPVHNHTPTAQIKKPPAKKSRLKSWASQVRFSWVAMALLFTVIISSICVIVLQYNIHKSKYAFFGRFKFNEEERQLRLLSSEGEELARIFVASLVGNSDLPYDCGLLRSTRVSHTSKYLAESTSEGRGVCLEWKNQARVTLEQVRPERLNCSGPVCRDIQCYRVDWHALSPSVGLMDCFSLTEPAGQTWFGSSEWAAAGGWPLGAELPLAPLVTGDVRLHTFGNVVQRSFLSSNGVGVYAWSEEPMFVRVDAAAGRLCLGNLRRPFPYRYPAGDLEMLYSICTGPSITQMHQFGTHVLNPYARRIEETRRKVWPSLRQIVYHFSGGQGDGNYTQQDVIAYGADIASRRYGDGLLVLDTHWQAYQGDLQFDPRRFRNAWKANELLQRKGLELAVTISPVVELKSVNIEYGIDHELWMREAVTGDPALVNQSGAKGAWMDISSTKTQDWLRRKLKKLKEVTKIKWVVIDQTAAQLLPFYYNLTEQVANPDFLSEKLDAVVRQAGLRVLSISSAVRPLQEPVFAQLSARPSSWAGLQQVLPSVLAAGTGGLQLVAPPVVGGAGRAEPQLYARWLQLACFLPRVQFARLPHQLGAELEQMANTLLWQRRQLVLPAYRSALREALAEGWPMVRPLWHQFGDDPRVAPIADQFLIGSGLMVAPVTQPNVTSRRVYLPAGLWREVASGRLDSGGRWIEQPVTDHSIPHYQLYRPDTE